MQTYLNVTTLDGWAGINKAKPRVDKAELDWLLSCTRQLVKGTQYGQTTLVMYDVVLLLLCTGENLLLASIAALSRREPSFL